MKKYISIIFFVFILMNLCYSSNREKDSQEKYHTTIGFGFSYNYSLGCTGKNYYFPNYDGIYRRFGNYSEVINSIYIINPISNKISLKFSTITYKFYAASNIYYWYGSISNYFKIIVRTYELDFLYSIFETSFLKLYIYPGIAITDIKYDYFTSDHGTESVHYRQSESGVYYGLNIGFGIELFHNSKFGLGIDVKSRYVDANINKHLGIFTELGLNYKF